MEWNEQTASNQGGKRGFSKLFPKLTCTQNRSCYSALCNTHSPTIKITKFVSQLRADELWTKQRDFLSAYMDIRHFVVIVNNWISNIDFNYTPQLFATQFLSSFIWYIRGGSFSSLLLRIFIWWEKFRSRLLVIWTRKSSSFSKRLDFFHLCYSARTGQKHSVRKQNPMQRRNLRDYNYFKKRFLFANVSPVVTNSGLLFLSLFLSFTTHCFSILIL